MLFLTKLFITLEFFLNGQSFLTEFSKFRESDESLNNPDHVSHTCLAGAVVASWSLTQEVAGLSPFTVMTNIFVTEFSEFSETFKKNSSVAIHECLFCTNKKARGS